MIGLAENLEVYDNYATGRVEGEKNNIGGLMGHVIESGVRTSYAMGQVRGTDEVGGLAGQVSFSSSVKTSYAMGEVEGTSKVGGLVGAVSSTSSVKTSYAMGEVEGTSKVGGLVGEVSSTSFVSTSYATGRVNGEARHFIGLKRTGGDQTQASPGNFVQGEDNNLHSVLIHHTGVLVGGVANPFTKKSFTDANWTFDGENADWHWLGNGKWPILKWQREAQGN